MLSLDSIIEVEVVSSDQIIWPGEGLYLRKFALRSKPSGTIKTRQLANLRGI